MRKGTRPIALLWPASKPPASLNPAVLSRSLRQFLRTLGFPRAGLTVWFGRDADLKRLNAQFCGKAKPTDVLSWPYLDPRARRPQADLGELALSLDRIRAQARENGWTMQIEALRLLAHGCAHLAGYDHRTRAEDAVMRKLEERLLARAGVSGLYPPPDGKSQRAGGSRTTRPRPAARRR